MQSLPRIVRAIGGGRVRTAVVTHANVDHFGVLVDAADRLGIVRVLVCQSFLDAARSRGNSAAGVLLDRLSKQGVKVETVGAGDEVEFGEVVLRFVWPPKDGEVFENVNDTSLVGMIVERDEPGVCRALLTGDIGPRAMRAVRDRHPELKVDVLEVPHHGSFNHEAAALVQALNPAVVVQSTGRQRAGDPRWEVARVGREWFCTATDGAITTIIGNDGMVRVGGFVQRTK